MVKMLLSALLAFATTGFVAAQTTTLVPLWGQCGGKLQSLPELHNITYTRFFGFDEQAKTGLDPPHVQQVPTVICIIHVTIQPALMTFDLTRLFSLRTMYSFNFDGYKHKHVTNDE
jgi:hypothetical protein